MRIVCTMQLRTVLLGLSGYVVPLGMCLLFFSFRSVMYMPTAAGGDHNGNKTIAHLVEVSFECYPCHTYPSSFYRCIYVYQCICTVLIFNFIGNNNYDYDSYLLSKFCKIT